MEVCDLFENSYKNSSVKWKMIYMHARLTWRKESSALVMQAELR